MRAADFSYIDTKLYNISFYRISVFLVVAEFAVFLAMYVRRKIKEEDSFIQSLLQPHVHAIPPTLWPLLSLACNSAYIWLYGT